MTKPRIILAGGSGFLGGALAGHFSRQGAEVIILTRSPRTRSDGVTEVLWDAHSSGAWGSQLEGACAVINLTGRSVDCRYNDRNRKEILESRVASTLAIGRAIDVCETPPRVWLNASTATIYQHTFDHPMDESSQEMDATPEARDAFSVEVAKAWEQALYSSEAKTTRKVALRSSMVLGMARNSVFPVLRRLTNLGLGGPQGSGRQFVSWIHEKDFCRAIEWILNHDELAGPVNVCAPNPVPNAAMMKLFREVCRRPFGLPSPEWLLEIGALLLCTETELVLKSRRVVPQRLVESGFGFHFPEMREALEDLQQAN